MPCICFKNDTLLALQCTFSFSFIVSAFFLVMLDTLWFALGEEGRMNVYSDLMNESEGRDLYILFLL